MMAGAGSSSEPSGLISAKFASLYRKEIAAEQTSFFAGAGKPWTLRRLSETEIVERKRKLSAYDASLPDTRRGAKGKWAKKISSLIADTKDIKEATTQIKEAQEGIKKDTTCILGLLKVQEVERDTDQSDKERLKQIRTIKRQLDNEVADLKEREAKRVRTEKVQSCVAVEEAV